MVQEVAVAAHVVHEPGHVSTLPGEHHFRGSVINVSNRQAHFVASDHQFPGARVDLLTRAKEESSAVWAEDCDSVMNVRGCRRCHAPRSLDWPQKRRGRRPEPEATCQGTRAVRKPAEEEFVQVVKSAATSGSNEPFATISSMVPRQ